MRHYNILTSLWRWLNKKKKKSKKKKKKQQQTWNNGISYISKYILWIFCFSYFYIFISWDLQNLKHTHIIQYISLSLSLSLTHTHTQTHTQPLSLTHTRRIQPLIHAHYSISHAYTHALYSHTLTRILCCLHQTPMHTHRVSHTRII